MVVRTADHAVMEVWLMVGPFDLGCTSHKPTHQHYGEHRQ
jgi:hypothetical protein